MLTKDLRRVSRRGGDFHPEFVDSDARPLANRLLEVYRTHVGERRAQVEAAVEAVERESDDFKLVRGFAALLERAATFETTSPLPPERTRKAVFEASEAVGVASTSERERALKRAADHLHTSVDAVEQSLYADRDVNQVLVSFDAPWSDDDLVTRYNLSLAQTCLFDAREVRARSSNPRTLISAIKRLRLMYELRREGDERVVVVTGPDALFRRTRRYGTAFARLLRTLVGEETWRLEATIDDRGTDREMVLTHEDLSLPDDDPITEPSFDSHVEADFAARFASLDLDWELHREPEALATGTRVMIPDFAFDYRPPGATGTEFDEGHGGFRVYFEIMGFWTPDYVEKKLAQFEDAEDVELIVAVDESLGVGEAVDAQVQGVISYSGRVRVKDVVDVLNGYEADLVEQAAASLPSTLIPDEDVIGVAALAERHGVGADSLGGIEFPEHDRVGRTLVRPAVLERVDTELEAGIPLEAAESLLESVGLSDTSAVLSRLGYRVEWEGLGGGVVRRKGD